MSRWLKTPLVVSFGIMIAAVTFAGPASADDGVYPPPVGPDVLGASQVQNAAPVKVAGAADELAFTGSNAIAVGSLGGLLLAGGTTLVLVSRRRRAND